MEFIIKNITIDSNDCWNWNKSCSSSGYGQFTKNKIYYNTHRYVYEKINGKIESDEIVRHICHNRKCCNPNHLVIGSHKDNYEDSRNVHNESSLKRRLSWIIAGVEYSTIREANLKTGIVMNSLIKYTDKETRIFDIDSYRLGCEIARVIPKL